MPMKMKRYYYLIIIGAVAPLLLVHCIAASNEPSKMSSLFPGYHMVGLRELDSATSDFFLKNNLKNNPGTIEADFNGDDYLDYAVLVRRDNSNETKLAIVLCAGSSSCEITYQLDVSDQYDSVYLTAVKRGTILTQAEAIDTKDLLSDRITLEYDGVKLTYFGKAAVVLYWDKKTQKIRTIQTED